MRTTSKPGNCCIFAVVEPLLVALLRIDPSGSTGRPCLFPRALSMTSLRRLRLMRWVKIIKITTGRPFRRARLSWRIRLGAVVTENLAALGYGRCLSRDRLARRCPRCYSLSERSQAKLIGDFVDKIGGYAHNLSPASPNRRVIGWWLS